MIHIDHIAIGCTDLYEASDRMRKETGLGFYDGGWFPPAGIANKIFPLGGQTYMEIESVVNSSRYSFERGSLGTLFRRSSRESSAPVDYCARYMIPWHELHRASRLYFESTRTP